GGIQRPSLFEWQVGAHNVPFEACSGFIRIAARRLADPPLVGRCSGSFSDSGALLAASVVSGAYPPLPRQGFHLQETRPLSAAHIRTRVSALRGLLPGLLRRGLTERCHGRLPRWQ